MIRPDVFETVTGHTELEGGQRQDVGNVVKIGHIPYGGQQAQVVEEHQEYDAEINALGEQPGPLQVIENRGLPDTDGQAQRTGAFHPDVNVQGIAGRKFYREQKPGVINGACVEGAGIAGEPLCDDLALLHHIEFNVIQQRIFNSKKTGTVGRIVPCTKTAVEPECRC